ncbi:MAG: 2Fe-2S iron-sulfur cluster-binding protein [Gammaproteobacteria bacterium]
MAQYLTLSRAARLAGVKRGALQRRISEGVLPTFEGMIELSDLLRAYPDARVDDNTMLEHVDSIKRKATPRSLRESTGMPDVETVVARVADLSEELARTKTELRAYTGLIERLQARLADTERAAGSAAGAVRALRAWFGQQLDQRLEAVDSREALIARDAMLRLMTAHVHLFPSGHDFFVEGNDTILEAGLQAGYALKYGCADGSCGECKARLLAGKVKEIRACGHPLSAAERRQGYLLTCCNTAITDIELETREARNAADIPRQTLAGEVCKLQRPTDDMALLHVKTQPRQRLHFLAGQYVSLAIGDAPPGQFSVANCPCDETYLQFHVSRAAPFPVADYVFNHMTLSDRVVIEGPHGDFTLDEDSGASLILIAWDAGFAPIKSLAENAMALDVAETLHLYWVAPAGGSHYQHNLCRSWADALDNFRYTPLEAPAAGPADRGGVEAAFNQVIEDHPDLNSFVFYVSAPRAVLDIAVPYLLARGLPRVQLITETIHQGEAPEHSPAPAPEGQST